jgi:lipoprotein-anchoring transpeptidase ErfK/SrfK
LPSLSVGSSGRQVGLLERRLTALGYHLGGPDRRFDVRTADALIAFNKVQGRARVGYVDRATWAALARPRPPQARDRRRGFHIEVDQTRQVLYVVRGGRVQKVLHVSTGAGGATRDGRFSFHRKLAGYSPNRLYYPSYFDGLRAIHGWPEVPTYNASHGCVRVPMWAARWIYAKIEVGDQILIYH